MIKSQMHYNQIQFNTKYYNRKDLKMKKKPYRSENTFHDFPAHIRSDIDGEHLVQTARDHCVNVAEYASQCMKSMGLSDSAYLAGLLHDMGKFTEKFRGYITDAADGIPVIRGSVNHTFAGVRYIQTELSDDSNVKPAMQMLTKDLLSFAVGAHHGLFDFIDVNGRDGIQYRVDKEGTHYEEAVQNFLSECTEKDRIDEYYGLACRETETLAAEISELAGTSQRDQAPGHARFYLGITARFLLSSVIDADRRDTAQFMQGIEFPELPDNMSEVWHRELEYAESKITTLDSTSPINKARRIISDRCRKMADTEGGLYRLNVPTGAGKTISSLRFALAHAARWDKKRIIFTAPLLTILEQNAEVIKNYISDPSMILEHHSNVVQPEEGGDELRLSELYTENWDAPIIITTLVQLLNTMFSGKTSCIRRFHSLLDSIIIIDEVQSVPSNMLTLFNLMISYLCAIGGVTVVLCSATQPYLEGAQHSIAVTPKDLFSYDPEIWKVFHRNNLISAGKCRKEGFAGKVLELSEGAGSVLIICNKKSESEALFRELSKNLRCYHISASMCMEHRRKVLKELKDHLNDNSEGPVVCISTQVMEAGVDISFERVIRLMAGMDSCVQAAGRCNRNGEKEEGKVYILECTDENLSMLKEIRQGKDASRKLLYDYAKRPENFRGDLSSEESIRRYYMHYYHGMPQRFQDFCIPGRDKDSIYTLLGTNATHCAAVSTKNKGKRAMGQAFKEAGRYFHVFDEDVKDVIVPYGAGRQVISELCSSSAAYDPSYCRGLLEQAKGYTVTLYPEQRRKLETKAAVTKVGALDVYILSDGYYDPDTGIVMEPKTTAYMEI